MGEENQRHSLVDTTAAHVGKFPHQETHLGGTRRATSQETLPLVH